MKNRNMKKHGFLEATKAAAFGSGDFARPSLAITTQSDPRGERIRGSDLPTSLAA